MNGEKGGNVMIVNPVFLSALSQILRKCSEAGEVEEIDECDARSNDDRKMGLSYPA